MGMTYDLIVALGMTYVLILGGLDLSVGSNIALSGIITTLLLQKGWVGVPLAIGIGLSASFTIGASSKKYVDNWDKVFGEGPTVEEDDECGEQAVRQSGLLIIWKLRVFLQRPYEPPL